jgi:subtilisin family serine protease
MKAPLYSIMLGILLFSVLDLNTNVSPIEEETIEPIISLGDIEKPCTECFKLKVKTAKNIRCEKIKKMDWTSYFRNKYEMSQKFSLIKEKHKKKIKIAIIDTGLDNHNFILMNAVPKDIRQNLNKLDFSGENTIKDYHGHGSHVASIILGVNPKAQIIPIKYYNKNHDGQESLKAFLSALNKAVEMNVDIINISGGGSDASQEELAILKKAEEKGIIVISAAGNEKTNIDKHSNYYFPASYIKNDLKNIIVVGNQATKKQDKSYSSNYGYNSVDFFTRGEEVMGFVADCKIDKMTGTSQATPVVAGIVSTYMSIYPKSSLNDIRNHLVFNSTPDKKGLSKFGFIQVSKVFSTQFVFKSNVSREIASSVRK